MARSRCAPQKSSVRRSAVSLVTICRDLPGLAGGGDACGSTRSHRAQEISRWQLKSLPCANHTKAHESKWIERKEKIAMTTQTLTRPEANETEKKIKKLRELYADAPELGRTALERLIGSMKDGIISDTETSSAGRTGLRRGKVSELTIVFPIAPGGAKKATPGGAGRRGQRRRPRQGRQRA